MEAVAKVWPEKVTPVITSANDGKHMMGSFHYRDLALDLRTYNIPKKDVKPTVLWLARELGGHYDVILEKDHIHVELSPSGWRLQSEA